jgi:hypothetical protein
MNLNRVGHNIILYGKEGTANTTIEQAMEEKIIESEI